MNSIIVLFTIYIASVVASRCDDHEPDSPRCNHQGTYECGECHCTPGIIGDTCHCDLSAANDTCKAHRNAPLCNGRGSCECGFCTCYDERFSGQFCECDDKNCPRYDGRLCSGQDHGFCHCGSCYCLNEWAGEACECPKSKDQCLNPETGVECSGNGFCECGKCRCMVDGNYRGTWCEECPTCPGKCSALKKCVECNVFQEGPLTEEECSLQCSDYHIKVVDEVNGDTDARLCSFFRDGDSIYRDCRFHFTYSGSSLYVEKPKQCKNQPIFTPHTITDAPPSTQKIVNVTTESPVAESTSRANRETTPQIILLFICVFIIGSKIS